MSSPHRRFGCCFETRLSRGSLTSGSAPASLIGAWVAAHRALVDQELFLTPPADAEPAFAVTDAHPPTANGGIDETDPATASQLVAACEAAWADIRTHHPDLPAAVVVLGTGVERGRLVKLGHWWGGQWLADGQARGEVLLAGEALHLEPSAVFEVLLHEAAHGINAGRGIKDASRGGRYHNKHFATTAREALLRVRSLPPYGLAATELTPAARERYAPTIERLGEAMRIARQIRRGVQLGSGSERDELSGQEADGTEQGDGERKKDNGAAACGCGRKMRMAPKTLAAGPVLCGLCGSEFRPSLNRDTGRDAAATGDRADGVVDRSFLDRRQTALSRETAGDVSLPEPVVRVLQSQRDRIEGLIAGLPDARDSLQRSLADRRERIERALVGTDPPPSRTDDGQVLGEWYERWETIDERPMPAADQAEAARRERMARALLRADGSLHGPVITTATGLELQAGDRVQAVSDYANLPAGTLGTIEQVDPDGGVVGIDFATWGRLRTTLEDGLLAELRHDYAEIGSGGAVGPELDLPGMEP